MQLLVVHVFFMENTVAYERTHVSFLCGLCLQPNPQNITTYPRPLPLFPSPLSLSPPSSEVKWMSVHRVTSQICTP